MGWYWIEKKRELKKLLFITGTRADFGKIEPLASDDQWGAPSPLWAGTITILDSGSAWEAISELSDILSKKPKRGDVVVFKTPSDNRTDYIKRLIGIPGDVIQFIDGDLFINNNQILKTVIKSDEVIFCGNETIKPIFFFISSVYNVGDGPTMGRALLSTEIFPLVAWLARVTQSGLKSAVEAQRAGSPRRGLGEDCVSELS